MLPLQRAWAHLLSHRGIDKILLARKKKKAGRKLPGRPGVKTPCFHYRGSEFDPWWGNKDFICHEVQSKKKQYKCTRHFMSPTPVLLPSTVIFPACSTSGQNDCNPGKAPAAPLSCRNRQSSWKQSCSQLI